MKRIIIDGDRLLHEHIDAAKQQLLLTLGTAIENRGRGRPCQAIALHTRNLRQRLLPKTRNAKPFEQCDQSTQVEPRTQASREVQMDRKLMEKRSQTQDTTRQHPIQTTDIQTRQDEPPSSRDGKRRLGKNQPAHLEAKKRKEREEREMNDEGVLETMDEVGEDEGEAKDNDEPDEPSEEDVVRGQIEQEAQQTQAQMATDRVEPAGAGGRVHPEVPVRDPAREREQRRQQLRAKLRNAQQEREDLRFMLQELEG